MTFNVMSMSLGVQVVLIWLSIGLDKIRVFIMVSPRRGAFHLYPIRRSHVFW